MKKFQPAWQSLLKKGKSKMNEEEKDKLISEELINKDLNLDEEIELDDLPV